jgi:site-specific recombinase XerD
MINKGASADQVQNILGHQSSETTLRCYCKVDKATVKAAHHKYVN